MERFHKTQNSNFQNVLYPDIEVHLKLNNSGVGKIALIFKVEKR